MRISLDDRDVGYRLWRALWAAGRSEHVRVYVDDVLQDKALLRTADEDQGTVWLLDLAADGHPKLTREGELATKLVWGKVRIHLDPESYYSQEK